MLQASERRTELSTNRNLGEVTQSQAHAHYSLEYCAARKAHEADWTSVNGIKFAPPYV